MQRKSTEITKEALLDKISDNLREAWRMLGDYQYEIPPCPVAYMGDDRKYMAELYNWYYLYPHQKTGEMVGKLLVEHVSPDFLSRGSIYGFQELIGDYYLSEGNNEFALAMYDFTCHTVMPSNYADVKRWTLQLKIAKIFMEMKGREKDALRILKRMYAEVKNDLSFFSSAEMYLQYTAALVAEVLERIEKGRGYRFLCQESAVFDRKEHSFYLFCIALEIAVNFQEYEDLCMHFLKTARRHSILLLGLNLRDVKYDLWTFDSWADKEGEMIRSDNLRNWLEICLKNMADLRG
ncbi:hypothetical protein [uncultured Eubacterium sp.]|uniref:hypothetical protein n=1 Tax=uncultured Eubacterium sp. TaxID=165185 RepID=UPI002601249C|nr:hypothetical protein [uncultured Eubacterium sp.]